MVSVSPGGGGAWIYLPVRSPGSRVPLGFTLDQDVVAGIHDVVLHRLLGDGWGAGILQQHKHGRLGLRRPGLGSGCTEGLREPQHKPASRWWGVCQYTVSGAQLLKRGQGKGGYVKD